MILTLIGARPQFVKAAVVSRGLTQSGLKEIIVNSGQHYDENMSDVFWRELDIPPPYANLNVGSGNHAEQTAAIMSQLDRLLTALPHAPRAVLVYGDTNTTIAGSLVASKRHVPVIHVEAGLRSFNKRMPEEVNRVVTDHLAELLFCPSQIAVNNLKREGVTENVYDVGDVMFDALSMFLPLAQRRFALADIIQVQRFALLTIHRPSNTDDTPRLQEIMVQLGKLSTNVVWPVHPRNRQHLARIRVPPTVHLIDPVSYLQMLVLLTHAEKVITDSGGLQKEAYWMRKPCITLRDETEWTETLEGGWNRLAGPEQGGLVEAYSNEPHSTWKPLYGKGRSCETIIDEIRLRYHEA